MCECSHISYVPEDWGPECLQRGPVVEDEVDVVAQQGHQGDREHRGHEEQEEDVELAVSSTSRAHVLPELEEVLFEKC